ncbi:MAG: CHAT domain-containing tetratricopeptide repeat protein, partial [Bacteroidota bacterium]
EISRAYHTWGELFSYQGKYDSAMAKYRLALGTLASSTTSGGILAQADNLSGVGYIFKKLGKYDSAKHYLEMALTHLEAELAPPHAKIANQLNSLGLLNLSRDPDLAEGYFEQAQAMFTVLSGEESQDIANIRHNLGMISYYRHEYDRAMAQFAQAKRLRLKLQGVNHPHLANHELWMGRVLEKQGRYYEAEKHWLASLDLIARLKGEDHPNLMPIYQDLGTMAYFNFSHYRRAKSYYEKGLKIAQKTYQDPTAHLVNFYHGLSRCWSEIKDYDLAARYLQQCIQAVAGLPYEVPTFLATCYNSLGINADHRGELEEALSYFTLAVDQLRSRVSADPNGMATYYINAASTFSKLSNYQQAENYYDSAKQVVLSYQMEDSHVAASYWFGRASVAGYQEKLGKSTQLYRVGLKVLKRAVGPAHAEVAYYLGNLASVLTRSGEWSQARRSLAEAMRILNYDPSHPDPWAEVVSLGMLDYVFQGVNGYYQAHYRYTQQAKDLDSVISHLARFIALENEIYRRLSSSTAEATYQAEGMTLYQSLLEYLLMRDGPGDRDAAFEWSERSRGRRLRDRLSAWNERSRYGVPDSVLEKEEDLENKLSFYRQRLFQSPSPTDSLSKDYVGILFRLSREKEALAEAVKRDYPAYYSLRYGQPTLSRSEVQRYTRGGLHAAVVEYFLTDSSIIAFVILAEDFHVLQWPRDVPLKAWIKAIRPSLDPQENTTARDSFAHQLYLKLFAPIQGLLPEGASVLIIPDGVLGYLPFEALLTRARDEAPAKVPAYLLANYPLSYAYSATLHQEMQRKTHAADPPKNLLAVAPTFQSEPSKADTLLLASRFIDTSDRRNFLTPLQYNIPEAQSIARQCRGEVLLGAEATEAAFVQRASDYRILHLSTHGKANDRAGDYSFLAFHQTPSDSLENEWLYNREIYNLKLNADLVVLSACETGIGELQRGEGIISLARGFSYAGAKSLVTSLWNVNDRSSMELMESFYGYLAEGQPKQVALQQAKLDYLESHPAYLQSPFYWAAFIAIGDMKPVELNPPRPWGWIVASLGIVILLVLGYRRWS